MDGMGMETSSPAITHLAAHRSNVTLLSEDDLWLWSQGRHFQVDRMLGAHSVTYGGARGTSFAVWAPNAGRVSVIGDFNQWDRGQTPLNLRGSSGLWEGFVSGVDEGARYQYHVVSRETGAGVDKADPIAFYSDPTPAKVSVVRSLDYDWKDQPCRRA